jgi:hypothetical protein
MKLIASKDFLEDVLTPDIDIELHVSIVNSISVRHREAPS